MKIQLNGQQKEISEHLSLADILSNSKLDRNSVVIEYNHSLLSDEDSLKTPLQDGDNIEIVRFVGGG